VAEQRDPEQGGAPADAAAPVARPSFFRRIWNWFSEQNVLAKFTVSILTAVVTALAVGGVTRLVFSDDHSGPAPLPPHAAPFSVSTRLVHGSEYSVWLDEALPDASRWPPADADGTAVTRFLRTLGSTDETTWVRIVLDGTAGRTSTVTDAHAVIVKRQQPSPAALFHFSGEGSQDVVGWFFDLDEFESPAHQLKDTPDRAAPLYFANKTVTVAPGEVVTIDAIAATRTCDCLWKIELEVVVDGKPRIVRIDDDGKPFHTSGGPTGVPEYLWAYLTDDSTVSRFQLKQPDGSYAPVAPQ
jgi:hypothetical protein